MYKKLYLVLKRYYFNKPVVEITVTLPKYILFFIWNWKWNQLEKNNAKVHSSNKNNHFMKKWPYFNWFFCTSLRIEVWIQFPRREVVIISCKNEITLSLYVTYATHLNTRYYRIDSRINLRHCCFAYFRF